MIVSSSVNNSRPFLQKNFATVIKEYDYNFQNGDIVAGTIFNIEVYGALVDVGASIVAYLPINEIPSPSSKNLASLKINETREFLVLNTNKNTKQVILSIRGLEYIRAWKRIKQMQEENAIIKVSVISSTKGGILANLEGLKGFIPRSHIINKTLEQTSYPLDLQVKCLDVDEKNNSLVLSHRCAVLEQDQTQFHVGQIVTGIIEEIQDYGVFIDLGHMKGLLHISEISNSYISNLYKVFKIGDKINVTIMHVDIIRGRISLSIKQMNMQNKDIQNNNENS